MSNIKRNILVYLDNYPMVTALPPEQRGWLFTALMVYGDRLCRGEESAMEEIMEQFPKLTPEARMVCGFMGANILRDTQKWLNRQQFRSRKNQPAPGQPAAEQRAAEDMERTRRLMEKLQAQEGQEENNYNRENGIRPPERLQGAAVGADIIRPPVEEPEF